MIALELAESADAADDRIQTYLSLATRHKAEVSGQWSPQGPWVANGRLG
jgi:hypothetical protein